MSEGLHPPFKHASYWKLLRGERVLKSAMEWEDPIATDNLDKLIKHGDVAGQMTFDLYGKFDTIYFLRKQDTTK